MKQQHFGGSCRSCPPSYLGDVLHSSRHWIPFCWIINNKVLPEVTEQLPGEDRWGFARGTAPPNCPSTARSCPD